MSTTTINNSEDNFETCSINLLTFKFGTEKSISKADCPCPEDTSYFSGGQKSTVKWFLHELVSRTNGDGAAAFAGTLADTLRVYRARTFFVYSANNGTIMNKDMKVFFSANVRAEEESGDVMRNALSLIAKEIQRFRYEYEAREDDDNAKTFKTLNTCVAKINTKNRELKKLKENLKIACNVARILLSDKNKEADLLAHQLDSFQNQSSELSRDNAQHLSLIQQLRMENFKINNDMQLLRNIIHLGYEKLQQMGHAIPTNVPFIVELKTILLACGQYYADFCNEREQSARLERQNRFLKNKITILERNLADTTEELRNLRNQNVRLRVKFNLNQRHGEAVKKLNGSETFPVKRYKSDEFDIANSNEATLPKIAKYSREMSNKTSYLTSHLDTVRKLLSDQNKMLQELKDLQEEFLMSDK